DRRERARSDRHCEAGRDRRLVRRRVGARAQRSHEVATIIRGYRHFVFFVILSIQHSPFAIRHSSLTMKLTSTPTFGQRDPDARGYYGPFGGRFVPETLVAPIEELEREYYCVRQDLSFLAELDDLLA